MGIVEDIIKNETGEERQERLEKAAAKYLDNGAAEIPEWSDEVKKDFYLNMKKSAISGLQSFRQRRRSAKAVDDKVAIAKWTKLAALEMGYLQEAEQQLLTLAEPKEA